MVHYELPNSSEIFVHRSGRTGRAGKEGTAILIYSSNQYGDLMHTEREVGCRFSKVLVLFLVKFHYFSCLFVAWPGSVDLKGRVLGANLGILFLILKILLAIV